MGQRWPLTGRIAELGSIDAALRRADGPRGLVLAGAAGVGKTRLAQEALTLARNRGTATRWAAATASTRALPLGAFSALLGRVEGDQRQLLAQATAALVADKPGGVLVGVDDAHLLDALSAQLVHQLVLRRAATVVITVRSGEPAPDAVTALWKDGHLDRHEVRPLSEADTVALLEAVLLGQVADTTAGQLWRLTAGNALYLRLLVEQALDNRTLRRVGGVWHLAASPELSPGLAELVVARMGALPAPVRDVVDVLALAEPLGVSLLTRLTGAEAVEDAESRGLLTVRAEGRRLQAGLAHPLYGETRRAHVGLLRARRLRGRIATALAETGSRRGDDALRRAVLAVDSDLPPDAQLLADAAGTAVRLMDITLAERLARQAIDADDGPAFGARWALANALAWQGRGEETETEWARLADLADNDIARAMVAMPRAGNLFWILRRPQDAEAILDTAAAHVDDDARLVITAIQSAFHAFLARPRRAVDDATRALAVQALPDQAVVLATWGLAAGLGVLGRADELSASTDRAYTAATRCVEGSLLSLGLAVLELGALRLAGYLDEMRRVGTDRREAAANGISVAHGMFLEGFELLARGQLRTSIRRLREARSRYLDGDAGGWAFLTLLQLTQALAMAGDPPGARAALADLRAERHPSFVFMDPEVLLAQAWVAAGEGATTEATDLARQAADLAARRCQPGYEVLALHTAVRFGDRTAAARLAHLAETVDGPRAPAAVAHATALADDDGVALLVAAQRLEHLGDLLAAADAAAQAADAHARNNRRGSATSAAAAAHRLAEACEGARTPALRCAARPLPLTRREREIVTLAADGLSNREIADRLVVSVRTVEGHLYRASAKLGTTNRGDLAKLLRRTDARPPFPRPAGVNAVSGDPNRHCTAKTLPVIGHFSWAR